MSEQILLDIDPKHASLLAAAASVMFDGVEGSIRAIPMDRKSGRFHVYRLRIARRQGGPTRSFYVKVADVRCTPERQKELQRFLRSEYVSWRQHVRLEDSFQTMEAILLEIDSCGTARRIDSLEASDITEFEENSMYCLCYSSVGTAGSEPIPLADLLGDPLSHTTAGLVMEVIDRVNTLESSWRRQEQSQIVKGTSFAEEYKMQLRWELDRGRRGTKRFLEQWIGTDGKDKHASLLFELGLACPWEAVIRFMDHEQGEGMRRRPIHGDLHQRNIMIERSSSGSKEAISQAYLIDFEWTRPQHWLCDWVTLEASLKLFDCAAHFSESDILALHDALDCEHQFASVDQHRPGQFLCEIIGRIRELSRAEARETGISDDRWRQEYYAASLFVTLGMISMRGCPARLAYLTAAWMAGHLSD